MGVYANAKPPGAPDCWGDNWNPEDDVCSESCGFDGSCGVKYRKTYGDPYDEYEPVTQSGRVSVVRRTGRGRIISSSSQRSRGGVLSSRSTVSDGHPIIPEDEQEDVGLFQKVLHNSKIGAARAALDETYDLMVRRLLKIPKF